jgi:diguanylate cyclase (GGDEF)-like protein
MFVLTDISLFLELPRPSQEATIATGCVVVSGAESVMLAGSVHGSGGLLLAALLGNLMGGLVGSRVTTRVGAPLVVAWIVLFAARVGHMPGESAVSSIIQTINAAVIAIFVLGACWSLEIETRRGYALMLRARLGQIQLSSRNAELDILAMQDTLTGLANRRAFDRWIAAAWQHGVAEGGALGLIAIDVDKFKLYNDYYGHPGGDACLKAVAACLREQLRGTTDMLARVGGEEFAVILPGVNAHHCSDVAERLRQAVFGLQWPHLGKEQDRIVTVSLGAASLHPAEDGRGPDALLKAADAALYAAKHGGRNRVFVAMADGSAREPALVQYAGS